PALPVLVVSMRPGSDFARRVRAAGATEYLTKDTAPTELVEAIERIRGSRGLPGDRPLGWPDRIPVGGAAHDGLSDREYQVLRMLGSGRTVSEIAASLGLSVETVRPYRGRLLGERAMHNNGGVQ